MRCALFSSSKPLRLSCQRRAEASESLSFQGGVQQALLQLLAPRLLLPLPGWCPCTTSSPRSETQFICSLYILLPPTALRQGPGASRSRRLLVVLLEEMGCVRPPRVSWAAVRWALPLGRSAVAMAPFTPLIPADSPVLSCFPSTSGTLISPLPIPPRIRLQGSDCVSFCRGVGQAPTEARGCGDHPSMTSKGCSASE